MEVAVAADRPSLAGAAHLAVGEHALVGQLALDHAGGDRQGVRVARRAHPPARRARDARAAVEYALVDDEPAGGERPRALIGLRGPQAEALGHVRRVAPP